MNGKKRLLLIFSIIAVFVFLFSQCMETKKKIPATASTIAGSETCISCHKDIYNSYAHNMHAKTSSPIKDARVLDVAMPASNTFEFNDRLKLVVEKRDSAMYQVAYFDGQERISRRFDIAIGSGKHAFTYGSWRGNSLTQLPLSFFKEIGSWTNSPGFPKDRVYFERSISSKCLECHSAYADIKVKGMGGLQVSEEVDRKSIVYGIDCERCHGPSGMHVEFHQENPAVKEAKFMTLFKSLTRKQKVDACAICHSGSDLDILKSTFYFKPGDNFDDYYGHTSSTEPQLDVHGNQSQLLAESKCFVKSNDLTCGTCHSTHSQEREGLTAYSKKCMSCHNTIDHSEKTLKNAMVKTNCIECHMPLQTSKRISFQLAGNPDLSPYQLRTHKIAVYH